LAEGAALFRPADYPMSGVAEKTAE